jgi:hypothetical protein
MSFPLVLCRRVRSHVFIYVFVFAPLFAERGGGGLAHTPENTPNPALPQPVADAQLAKIGSKSLANKFKLHVDKYVCCLSCRC